MQGGAMRYKGGRLGGAGPGRSWGERPPLTSLPWDLGLGFAHDILRGSIPKDCYQSPYQPIANPILGAPNRAVCLCPVNGGLTAPPPTTWAAPLLAAPPITWSPPLQAPLPLPIYTLPVTWSAPLAAPPVYTMPATWSPPLRARQLRYDECVRRRSRTVRARNRSLTDSFPQVRPGCRRKRAVRISPGSAWGRQRCVGRPASSPSLNNNLHLPGRGRDARRLRLRGHALLGRVMADTGSNFSKRDYLVTPNPAPHPRAARHAPPYNFPRWPEMTRMSAALTSACCVRTATL